MPNTPPHDWGRDSLSRFLSKAHDNQLASFGYKKESYEVLSEVDDCLSRAADSYIECQPVIGVALFVRSHAAFRAACAAALATQFVESFPLCRLVIENALYAFHIYKLQDAGDIWLDRSLSEASLKKARKEFQYKNVLNTLENSFPDLSREANELYQRSISYGGHPNEPGVSLAMELVPRGPMGELLQHHMHGDSPDADRIFRNVAECGLFPLLVTEKMWRFRNEFSGVSERIAGLRNRL
jgi:hypothetical protein